MALSAYGLQAEPRFGGAGFSVLKAFRFHGRMAVLFGITWIASAADGDKQKSPARCIRAGLLSFWAVAGVRPERMLLKYGDARKAQCNEAPA